MTARKKRVVQKEGGASIQMVSMGSIIPGENDRLTFAPEALKELSDSIESLGLAQPITVRPLSADGEDLGIFQIVMGERRFRACQLLGWTEIAAFVREMDETTASALMLAENLQRSDLNPMEAAKAFQKRITQFNWTVQECADRSHANSEMVRKRLRLLKLCPEAQFLVEKNSLPLGHADIMSDLDNNRQILSLRLFHGNRPPTLAEFRSYCSELLSAQTQESMFDITEFTLVQQEAHQNITTKSGAGVKTLASIPRPRAKMTMGETLENYISDLHLAGHDEFALIFCTFYDAMVRSNFAHVPATRLIPAALLALEV